jgi:hypothetical protein
VAGNGTFGRALDVEHSICWNCAGRAPPLNSLWFDAELSSQRGLASDRNSGALDCANVVHGFLVIGDGLQPDVTTLAHRLQPIFAVRFTT